MLFIEKEPWHIGNEVPITKRVVKFQADGHELEMILKAMKLAYVNEKSEVVFHWERS